MGENGLGINNYFMTPDSMQYQMMLVQMSQQMALQAQIQQRVYGQQIQQNGLPAANQWVTQPTFKGGTQVSAEQQIQGKSKKKMSTGGKLIIGLGATAVGLVTAGKVSAYAQTSIGEFIAETYAKMVSGDTIPDDVLKLYKKYNGPLPKAFAA